MKTTELERFIKTETKFDLQNHHLFLTQLFMLSKQWEKENKGKPLSVFTCLLLYISEIVDRYDPALDNYMKLYSKVFEAEIKGKKLK